MNKIDLTTIKTLIKTCGYLHNLMTEYVRKHTNDECLGYIANIEALELEIGKEFCRITSDRNSMEDAHLIKLDYARKLVKDIEEGRYK